MGDLTRNFSRWEFACSCGCGFDDVSYNLLDYLEITRAFFGNKPITITSGCRCEEYNERLRDQYMRMGKPPNQWPAKNSLHLPQNDDLCHAADFWVREISANTVATFLERIFPHKCGVGRYINRTHLDDRPVIVRWDARP